MIPERVAIVKARPSLKAYLSSSITSKTMHTSIWKSSKAKEYDSNSYIHSFKLKNLVIENKRKWKERMRRLSEEAEYQRQFQMRDFSEDFSLFRDYYPTPDMTSSQYYPKAKNSFIDRWNLSKGNFEGPQLMKNPRDEIARNIEESEKRSTAVSCQERQSQKEIRLRSPPQMHYEDYHIEAEISNYDIHNLEEINRREKASEKNLVDKMYNNMGGFLDEDHSFLD